ncbi:hypothetical protein BC828DRAFT_436737 [Blastocladiella britannica]|nr:hypothetical protein BC828DRAFT_436737 [Blastocladiella britannica]
MRPAMATVAWAGSNVLAYSLPPSRDGSPQPLAVVAYPSFTLHQRDAARPLPLPAVLTLMAPTAALTTVPFAHPDLPVEWTRDRPPRLSHLAINPAGTLLSGACSGRLPCALLWARGPAINAWDVPVVMPLDSPIVALSVLSRHVWHADPRADAMHCPFPPSMPPDLVVAVTAAGGVHAWQRTLASFRSVSAAVLPLSAGSDSLAGPPSPLLISACVVPASSTAVAVYCVLSSGQPLAGWYLTWGQNETSNMGWSACVPASVPPIPDSTDRMDTGGGGVDGQGPPLLAATASSFGTIAAITSRDRMIIAVYMVADNESWTLLDTVQVPEGVTEMTPHAAHAAFTVVGQGQQTGSGVLYVQRAVDSGTAATVQWSGFVAPGPRRQAPAMATALSPNGVGIVRIYPGPGHFGEDVVLELAVLPHPIALVEPPPPPLRLDPSTPQSDSLHDFYTSVGIRVGGAIATDCDPGDLALYLRLVADQYRPTPSRTAPPPPSRAALECVLAATFTALNHPLKKTESPAPGSYALRHCVWQADAPVPDSTLLARALAAAVRMAAVLGRPEVYASATAARHLIHSAQVTLHCGAALTAKTSTTPPRLPIELLVPALTAYLWANDWTARALRQLASALNNTVRAEQFGGNGTAAATARDLISPAALLLHPGAAMAAVTALCGHKVLDDAISTLKETDPTSKEMVTVFRVLYKRTKLERDRVTQLLESLARRTGDRGLAVVGGTDEVAVLLGARIPPSVAVAVATVLEVRNGNTNVTAAAAPPAILARTLKRDSASAQHDPRALYMDEAEWQRLDALPVLSDPVRWPIAGALTDATGAVVAPAMVRASLAAARSGVDVVRKSQLARASLLLQCTTCLQFTRRDDAPVDPSPPSAFRLTHLPPLVAAPWHDASAFACVCGGRWWDLSALEDNLVM